MMKTIIFVLLFSAQVRAVSLDKSAHVAASMAVTQSVFIATKSYKKAFLIGLGIGLLKELTDRRFSRGDMGANLIGIFAGLSVPFYMNEF